MSADYWESDEDARAAQREKNKDVVLVIRKQDGMWPFYAVECVSQWEIERRMNPDLSIGDLLEGLRLAVGE